MKPSSWFNHVRVVITLGLLGAACSMRVTPDVRPVAPDPRPLTAKEPDAATTAKVMAAYGKLPLHFEANQGQTDEQVDFLSRGHGLVAVAS